MDPEALLSATEFWHWWILAIALGAIEVFAPGAIFIWMGAAAGIVGLVLLVLPDLSWQTQWIGFAVLSVASVAGWRIWARRHPTETDQPALNRRGEQYIGRTFVLEHPVANGFGKIIVNDTTWKIAGPDLPAGTRITVTGVDGTVLLVEAA